MASFGARAKNISSRYLLANSYTIAGTTKWIGITHSNRGGVPTKPGTRRTRYSTTRRHTCCLAGDCPLQMDRDLIAAITLAVRCGQVDSLKLPPRFQKRSSWLTVIDTADTNAVWNRPIPPLQAKFSAPFATANDVSLLADILQSPFSEVRLADVAMLSTPTMITTVQVKLSPESQSLNESNRGSKKQIVLPITHLRHGHSLLSNLP
jgi:hypothetical protein